MHKLLSILMAAWMLMAAGCNTMEGFGEDVESAGDAVEDKAAGEEDEE